MTTRSNLWTWRPLRIEGRHDEKPVHSNLNERWTWRPLRIDGRNRIGVYCGRRLALLLGPHEVDDAHALCGLRNLAATAPSARYRLFGNNGQ